MSGQTGTAVGALVKAFVMFWVRVVVGIVAGPWIILTAPGPFKIVYVLGFVGLIFLALEAFILVKLIAFGGSWLLLFALFGVGLVLEWGKGALLSYLIQKYPDVEIQGGRLVGLGRRTPHE